MDLKTDKGKETHKKYELLVEVRKLSILFFLVFRGFTSLTTISGFFSEQGGDWRYFGSVPDLVKRNGIMNLWTINPTSCNT